MAYQVQKKFIIDTQDKSVGVTLPFTIGNNGFFAVSYTTKEQVKSDLKNLILTNRGERLMQPEFGCNLRQAIFEQIGPETYSYIRGEIENSIQRWLPYIIVNNVDVSSDTNSKDNNRINVQLDYTLAYAGNNSRDSINITV
jgi:phage baseplate assembly protein W